MDRLFVIIGSILMLLGVGAGAFGAHGLSNYFSRFPKLEETYDTAIQFQVIHSLALFIVAWMTTRWSSSLSNWAGFLFILGIILFSGSLYLLVFNRVSWLGAITPIGGVAFLTGWAILGLVALRNY